VATIATYSAARTNRATNPGAEAVVTGWNSNDGAKYPVTLETVDRISGAGCVRTIRTGTLNTAVSSVYLTGIAGSSTLAVTPGETFTMSVDVKGQQANRNISYYIQYRKADNSALSASPTTVVLLPSGVVTRATVTHTVPALAAWAFLVVSVYTTDSSNALTGETVWYDNLLVGPTGFYFDGSTSGCAWTGTANASTSTCPEVKPWSLWDGTVAQPLTVDPTNLQKVQIAPESPFDQSTILATTLARNNTTAGSFTAQTWTVIVTEPVQFLSYTADIFQADTYVFSIDGTNIASVVCGAASINNVFAPSAPVSLAAGAHTFKMTPTATRRWYYVSASFSPWRNTTGTGSRFATYQWWQESTSNAVSGSVAFRQTVGLLDAGPAVADARSVATLWAAQTWTVTFGTACHLAGLQMQVQDTGPYTFSIDGVDVGAVASPATGLGEWVLFDFSSAPIALTAAAHTFKIRAASTRKYYYLTSAANPAIAGVGAGYITGWGVFQEFDAAHCPSAYLIFSP
jgi:hypothetical protein